MTHDHFSIKLNLLYQEYKAVCFPYNPTFEGFMGWIADSVTNLKISALTEAERTPIKCEEK